MPYRVTVGAAAIAVAILCLVSCRRTPPTEGARAPATTRPPVTATASKAMSADLGARFGALDTVLVYCIPGLPGSPRQGCDLDRILSGLTTLTTSVRTEFAPRPGQATATALTAIDGAIAALRPCTAWFAAGGTGQDPAVNITCDQAWDALTTDWTALKSGVHW